MNQLFPQLVPRACWEKRRVNTVLLPLLRCLSDFRQPSMARRTWMVA